MGVGFPEFSIKPVSGGLTSTKFSKDLQYCVQPFLEHVRITAPSDVPNI